MKRRAVVAVVLGILLPASGGRAQPTRKARIVFLSGSAPLPESLRDMVDPLRQGLRELGHVEGTNLEVTYRWSEGKPERLPGLAAELLALAPDVFIAVGPGPARLAKAATRSVPIVALAVDDPVEMGLAQSMARPGGNITGISSWGRELMAKRFQLMRELVPAARRYAVLVNPHTLTLTDADFANRARSLGITIQVAQAGNPDDYEAVFAALARDQVDALLVLADSTFYLQRLRIGALCLKQRLPSVRGGKNYLEAGGLASYQSDWPALFRRAAVLVDKILKGEKPGEIPFEQTTKLELAVNLKAARALGIAVPQTLLVAADEVIE